MNIILQIFVLQHHNIRLLSAHRELEAAVSRGRLDWPVKEVSSTSLCVTGPEPQVESDTFWQSDGEVHLGIEVKSERDTDRNQINIETK